MASSKVRSLSDADTRLAALNTEILALEMERSALLAAELENAQGRVSEIQAFIGVYQASSSLGGSSSAPVRKKKRAAKKKSTGARRGRPPGKKKAAPKKRAKAAPKAGATAAPKKKRTRGNNAERLGTVVGLVKGAGKDGISARKVAKETGFPYVSVLNILNSGKEFKKVGEKRDRRYFLK